LSLLRWILAFSDQDANHVEVSVLAGFPNVIECLFDSLVFADNKGSSALRVLNRRQLVEVCFPFEKEVDCSRVTIVACIMKRSPLSVVKSHDICSFTEEKFKALLTALFTCKMKWCTFMLIQCFQGCTAFEKACNNVNMFHESSEVEGSLELV